MSDEEHQESCSSPPVGPLAWIRLVAGLSLWAAQIAIGALAVYMKQTDSMGVVITFLYGVPIGLVLCIVGGLLIPRRFRMNSIILFAVPILISFGCMVFGMIGFRDT